LKRTPFCTGVTLLWFGYWCGEGLSLHVVIKAGSLAAVEYASGSLDNIGLPLATVGLNWALSSYLLRGIYMSRL
jgi:hypothetical protein